MNPTAPPAIAPIGEPPDSESPSSSSVLPPGKLLSATGAASDSPSIATEVYKSDYDAISLN